MNAPGRISAPASAWLLKADEDLQAAETLLRSGTAVYEVICFHAQQCVEKCLKALLTREMTSFPYVHDLGELKALLPKRMKLPLTIEEAESLTDFAVLARYPGFGDEAGLLDARKAVATARRVRDTAVALFGSKAAGRPKNRGRKARS